MTQQGGDSGYIDGDTITAVNNNGSSISAGMLVYIDGHNGSHPTVSLSDSNSTTGYHGVVTEDANNGDTVGVRLRGVPVTRVESGVVAGDEITAGTTAGVATSGGSRGDVVLTDATQHNDGNYYAEVKLE